MKKAGSSAAKASHSSSAVRFRGSGAFRKSLCPKVGDSSGCRRPCSSSILRTSLSFTRYPFPRLRKGPDLRPPINRYLMPT